MKKIVLLMAMIALASAPVSAQSFLERMKERAKNAAENNIGNKVEKGVNDILNGEVGKKDKDDIGLRVNMPAKIKATLFQQEKPISSHTLYVGQLGTIENLSGALFGRKQTVRLTLNPITGALESIKEENLQ